MSATTSTSGRSPYATKHGILRWQIRGNEFDLAVGAVWHRAAAVTLGRPHNFDEIRLDGESNTLLCRRDSSIITVLYAEGEPVLQPSKSKECLGCGYEYDHKECQCPICGTEETRDD